MTHLRAGDYLRSEWAGGTTTQLAISPHGTSYAAREFLWRVSSATVELSESDFTPLPDYMRYIAPLQGEMTLTHDGGAPVRLTPMEVHCFDGGAATHSVGCCTDFNLMLRKGVCDGALTALPLQAGEVRELACRGELVVYCCEGALEVGGEVIAAGESVYACEAIAIRAQTDAALMLADIWKKI